MATALKEMAVGSLVKLHEKGLPIEFYVAKHDYESERNGAGRTLLVRKETCGLMLWHNTDLNLYATSDIDAWLNGEYKERLEPWMLKHIGETKIPCVIGNNVNRDTELLRSVFLLSLTEFGFTNANVNETGTALPTAGDLTVALYMGAAAHQWTRSPYQNAATNVAYVTTAGAVSNAACTNASVHVRPAFTVPGEKLFVLDDGTVEGNFVTVSGGEEALGEKAGTFSVAYSVTTSRGSAATVTERVYGKVIRSYTAVSGEEQTATVNTAMVPDGSHALSITAESDTGETAEKVCHFTVKPFARKGGTVQELQDEMGAAVFPVTMARAVLTEAGKSVQEVLDKPLLEKYKIGDILHSVKAGLGEEWLLCNGELTLARDYPELNELLLRNAEINAEVYRDNAFAYETLSNENAVYGCEGGKTFILHNEYATTGLTHVSIYENGKWETHRLVGLDTPPATKGTNYIRYSGGKYFFLEKTNYVSKEAGSTVYISEDLIHWEKKVLSFGGNTSSILVDIALAPGGQVFVVSYYLKSDSYTVYFGYGESLDATINISVSKSASKQTALTGRCSYAGGKFFSNYYSSSVNYVVTCNAETGEFTNATATGGTENVVATNVLYHDGYYYFAVSTVLCWSEDAVTWKTVPVTKVANDAYFSVLGMAVLAKKPTLVICNYSTSATVNVIQLIDMETMTKKDNKAVFAALGGAFRVDISKDGLRLIGYEEKSRTVGSAKVYIKTLTVREYDTLHGFRLPTIAEDSAYVYIKAKEENA